MSFYPKVDQVPVAVGILEQVVIAPFTGRGENPLLIVIENLSLTETFTGYAWTSPNGTTQWTQEPNDEFVDILPGKTRRMLLPSDRIWARVLGNFVAGPGSVRLSAFLLFPATWNPNTI